METWPDLSPTAKVSPLSSNSRAVTSPSAEIKVFRCVNRDTHLKTGESYRIGEMSTAALEPLTSRGLFGGDPAIPEE
eukprot:1194789-Amorphochlora_amoeboformis.AAC.1